MGRGGIAPLILNLGIKGELFDKLS